MNIASPIIIGPIFGSYVVAINSTLGWGDELTPLLENENTTCGCNVQYYKCCIVMAP